MFSTRVQLRWWADELQWGRKVVKVEWDISENADRLVLKYNLLGPGCPAQHSVYQKVAIGPGSRIHVWRWSFQSSRGDWDHQFLIQTNTVVPDRRTLSSTDQAQQ
jgi:hypothetical protein